MFNETLFQEILLPSLGNVNDYAAHIVFLDRNNKTYRYEQVAQCE